MSGAIRVFLVDDHDIVLEGARRLLASDERFTVIGVATDGAEVLNAPLDQCDVLMLDLSLPRYSGLEVLRRVRADHPALRVVVFSMYPREQYEARALAAGADAYIGKNTRSEELLETLYRVALGPASAASPAPTRPLLRHDTLSPREYQVFALLCDGRKTTEIAVELDLSASTVSNHIARIKQKLSVDSIAGIVAYAHREGIAA